MSKYFKIHLCFVLIYMYTSHIHQFISGRYKINNSWRACTSQKIWCWAIWNANIFKGSPLSREPGIYPSLPLSLSLSVHRACVFSFTHTHTDTCYFMSPLYLSSMAQKPYLLYTCCICSLNHAALRKPPGSKANF